MKLLLSLLLALPLQAKTSLNDVTTTLRLPSIHTGEAAPGKRVIQITQGWQDTSVHHALYLPTDWQPAKHYPVIIEYAGNGDYANKLGDTSTGEVEDCQMGYGLSQGRGFIWAVLPFIEMKDGKAANAKKWWGDIEETKRYCHATVQEVCSRYGGDAKRVVLAGFSRGAIACSYVGLHDDRIAALWCGLFAHSHFEGSFKHPAADQAAWPERVKRLGTRPLWISHELSTAKIEACIPAAANITFTVLPYPNHSTRWLLCDLPITTQAHDWLQRVTR